MYYDIVDIYKQNGGIYMARERKVNTLPAKLEGVVNKIDELEFKLKELKKEKKDLEDQIKKERLEKLNALMAEKGITFDELENLLNK